MVKRLYDSAFKKIGLNLCCFRWHLWKQLPSQWPATLAFHNSSTACDLRTFQPTVSPLKWIATPNLVFLEHRALFWMKTTFVNKNQKVQALTSESGSKWAWKTSSELSVVIGPENSLRSGRLCWKSSGFWVHEHTRKTAMGSLPWKRKNNNE